MVYDLNAALRRKTQTADPFMVCEGPPFNEEFLEDLRDFLSRRLERLDPKTASPEYAALQDKAAALLATLRAALPSEEARALLTEYSDTRGMQHYHEMLLLCERAFFDGVRLMTRSMDGRK